MMPPIAPHTVQQRRSLAMMGLVVLLIVAFGLNLSLGSVWIPPMQVAIALLGGTPDKAAWSQIVLELRLPQAVTALLAGAALATSGLQMQTLFANPLAGPYVLGIHAGASLGVALVVLLAGSATWVEGLGNLGVVTAASLGAGMTMGLVMLVATRLQSRATLLILGLMFGYVANAVVTVLLHFSLAERIQAYIQWTFGSFGGVNWQELSTFAPVVLVGLGMAIAAIKPLNLLLLGETRARSLGLQWRLTRLWLLASAALLAGSTTAFCGPVAFIGIAVPHLSQAFLGGGDRRTLLPACILVGSILALVADIGARLPGSQATLPLNAVTALLGAPIVIWVVCQERVW